MLAAVVPWACGGPEVVIEPELPPPAAPTAPSAAESRPQPAPVEQPPAPPAEPAPSAPRLGQSSHGQKLPTGLKPRDFALLGGELFVLHDAYGVTGQVSRVDPGGTLVSHRGPGKGGRLRTVGTGADAFVAATGPMGSVAVYRQGDWDYRLAPALEGEAVGAVAAGPAGVTWVAGAEHALYEWKGDTWTTHPYGSGGTAILDALVAKDGTLFLVGKHGRVLTYRAGRFADVQMRDLGPGPFVASWVDEANGVIWLAEDKRVVRLDVNQRKAEAFASELFFGIDHLEGARTPKGTLLLLTTFGRAALFDGKDWFLLSDEGSDGGVIDPQRKVAYLAARPGKTRVVDVKHPWLGTGPGVPLKR